MIRLVVLDQINNREHELDTYGNENIGLTLQVDDVRNIENKNASYSKEFNLPATKNNNKFFEHFYNVNRYSLDFDVYKNLRAFLYVDNILVLEGLLRLVNSSDKSTEISYSVVLFNNVANIIETLADDTIEFLSFADIAHEFTTNNIVASWSGATVLNAGGTTDNVYYPLINTTGIYLFQQQLNVDTFKNFLLNIRLKYLVDKIFEYAGFTYQSDFFESTDFTEIYMDCGQHVDGETGSDFDNPQIYAFVGNGSDATPGGNLPLEQNGYAVGLGGSATIGFQAEEGDDDNLFDAPNGIFTAAVDCVIHFELVLQVAGNSNGAVTNVLAGGIVCGQYLTNFGSAFEFTTTGTRTVLAGETLTFQVENLFGDTAVKNVLFGVGTSVKINVVDNSTDTSIKVNRGDIKLADILKDVVTMFNLTIEDLGNNTLKIEPYKDFVTNNIIDWTDKVNINERVIEPIEIPKRIILKHADDNNDYFLQQYRVAQTIDYGSQYILFDVDNAETLEISLNVFAAPYIQEIEGTNINVQHCAEEDAEGLKPFDNAPRLIYKNPNGYTMPANITLLDINDIEGGVSTWNDATAINNGTHYDGSADSNAPLPQLTANNDSLLFGYTPTFYTPTIGAQPLNTLYIKYWFDYLFEKFNVTNGLLVKHEIYLKPADINSFSFADKVKIKDQLYRVNKIEYNTDINTLAKVELLRI